MPRGRARSCSSSRYTSFFKLFTYAVTAVISIAGVILLQTAGKTSKFVDAALVAVAVYTVLGLLKTATSNESIEELLCYFTLALPFLVLPLFATEIWLRHNVFSKEAALSHVALGIFLVVMTIVTWVRDEITNLIVTANAASVTYAGYTNSNFHAIIAAIAFLFAHLGFTRCGGISNENLFNLCLTAFSGFAILSVHSFAN